MKKVRRLGRRLTLFPALLRLPELLGRLDRGFLFWGRLLALRGTAFWLFESCYLWCAQFGMVMLRYCVTGNIFLMATQDNVTSSVVRAITMDRNQYR